MLGYIIIGFLGVLVGLLIFGFLMSKYMIAIHPIRNKCFDEVNKLIKETVPTFDGWSFPIPSWEFYKSQISKGLQYENIKDMKMHFVCKPTHANSMLRKYPFFGGIMPCTWAVYETIDGQVYISKMNIGLMSMIFTGVIRGIMKDVARTEAAMLGIVKKA